MPPLSPEQIRDDPLTSQTDLFSLRIIMYEMLTDRHPFAAESFPRILEKIQTEDPPPLTAHRKDLPEMIEGLVRKTLAKNRQDRYATAADLATDLSKAFERLLMNQLSNRCQVQFLRVFLRTVIQRLSATIDRMSQQQADASSLSPQ